MSPTPGLLYVTMQPKPGLPESKFHEWYNNEHGPTRLRLPFCINGFRYRATDLEGSAPSEEKPEWMALYDITDMAELTKDVYLRLRDPPVKSQREVDTMAQIKVDRKLFDLMATRTSANFKELEKVEHEGEGNVIVAAILKLNEGEEMEEELNKWYTGEHFEMISKVPGWLRSRRYVTSSIDPKAPREFMGLHDFAPINGLAGPEMQAVSSTPWTGKIMSTVVKERTRRGYELYYTFGPAPRYLAPDLSSWHSSDVKVSPTKVIPSSPGGAGAIESYITTPDGVELNYRLEGSPNIDAPLIVLSNSILVDWGIWDDFVTSFFSSASNKKYRILRYQTRGRHSSCGTKPISMDVLAQDIISLLDALRVKKAAAIIGVSLGGATVLNTALKYPNRIASFISCDTSSKAPAGNSKAWGERIALSESENASSASGEKIVGEQLAEITTRRWFMKESYDRGALEKKLLWVKEMVQTNSFEGFKNSVEALWEYDLKAEMLKSEVKGLFVVGGGDGVLPGTMKTMSEEYGVGGGKGGYEVVDGAGHLPMVEKPEMFKEIVEKFLSL